MKFKVSTKNKFITRSIKVPSRDENYKKVTYVLSVTYKVLTNTEFQKFMDETKPVVDEDGKIIDTPIKDVEKMTSLLEGNVTDIQGLEDDEGNSPEFDRDVLYSILDDKDAIFPVYNGFVELNMPAGLAEARAKN